MTHAHNDAPASHDAVVLFGKYELRDFLGAGAFAKVYHGTRVADRKSVAIKAISKRNLLSNNLSANVEREISVTRRLGRHPNVIDVFEVLATKTKVYLVMEFAADGDLHRKVDDAGRLPEDLARRYFRQLISAVRHCHSGGIYHRDLKLDNLLLDDDGELKVSDFGLSAVKNPTRPDEVLYTRCGTLAYVAPEILAKKGYHGAMVDIWSCGVVLFTMTAGYLPFNDYNVTVLLRKIYRGHFRYPKWMSSGLKNLLSRLLDVNPQSRITTDEILKDPWFNSGGYRPDPVSVIEPKWGQSQSQSKVKSLNVFDLISFSVGLDLSGLFMDPGVSGHVDRVISSLDPEKIMERVEEVAKEVEMIVKRKEGGECARLEGQDGNLIALVTVYRLTKELVLVEFKSKGIEGFWKEKLQPQLKSLEL